MYILTSLLGACPRSPWLLNSTVGGTHRLHCVPTGRASLGSCIGVCVRLQLAALCPHRCCRLVPWAVLSDTSSRVEVLDASLAAAGNSKNRGCWLPVPGVGHGRAGSVPCPVSYLLLGSCFSCVTRGRAGEGDRVGDATSGGWRPVLAAWGVLFCCEAAHCRAVW